MQNERRYLEDVWQGVAPVHQTRWAETVWLLKRARVYIGPDTSVTHLAAAAGCPTVALFGPMDPRVWGPFPVGGASTPWAASGTVQNRGNVFLVQTPLPCVPCTFEGCERRIDSHSACLDELPPAQVLAAVDQALARVQSATNDRQCDALRGFRVRANFDSACRPASTSVPIRSSAIPTAASTAPPTGAPMKPRWRRSPPTRARGPMSIGVDWIVMKAGDAAQRAGLHARRSARARARDRNRVPRPRGRRRPLRHRPAGGGGGSAEDPRAASIVTDLRSVAVQGLCDAEHLPAIAEAKAVLHWHARHRFCSNCGAQTRVVQAGWRRDCPQCKTMHFPRTDPVVIMLVGRRRALPARALPALRADHVVVSRRLRRAGRGDRGRGAARDLGGSRHRHRPRQAISARSPGRFRCR